jgi:hypothetical protein
MLTYVVFGCCLDVRYVVFLVWLACHVLMLTCVVFVASAVFMLTYVVFVVWLASAVLMLDTLCFDVDVRCVCGVVWQVLTSACFGRFEVTTSAQRWC